MRVNFVITLFTDKGKEALVLATIGRHHTGWFKSSDEGTRLLLLKARRQKKRFWGKCEGKIRRNILIFKKFPKAICCLLNSAFDVFKHVLF